MDRCTTTDAITTVIELRKRLRTRPERRWIVARSGVRQRAIATEMGVSEATVSRWLDGTRTPRGHNLVAFVTVLDRLAREVKT